MASAAAYVPAAGAAASAIGLGLFGYNRANYEMDQKLHFGRYNAAIGLAIAQQNMYREDIEGMTGIVVAKMAKYADVAAMGLTILTALYCPGRVGLHTPPPPGWLMGLMFLNIAGTYCWFALTLWMSLHAAMRANSAATHMLTRWVRVPVPTQWMLDRARKWFASWEEQPLKEVFRIPFTRHQGQSAKIAQTDPNAGRYNKERTVDDGESERRIRAGWDVPAWYRKERCIDGGNPVESIMPLAARGTRNTPEHMEVYREIQNEWWQYDVYARICTFLAFMHITHVWAYHQIGHHLQETRSIFAVTCVILCIFVLQQCILTLDIGSNETPIHRIGPFAPLFALAAGVCEYSRWYWPGVQALGFACVYFAYFIQIVYTIRLYQLCSPDFNKPPEPQEVTGRAWWPKKWALPRAFSHAIWVIAPPQELEFHDLVGEMALGTQKTDLLGVGVGDSVPAGPVEEDIDTKRKDIHNALGRQGESPAWFNVKTGLIALTIGWVWLTLGFTVEVINQGTNHPALMNAPGMPNNARDPRYRMPKPGKHEPVEVGTGGLDRAPGWGPHFPEGSHRLLSDLWEEEASPHGDVARRRLEAIGASSAPMTIKAKDLAVKVKALFPILQELATGSGLKQTSVAVGPTLVGATAVQWPPLFEPRLLACSPSESGKALALSHHGRGAVFQRMNTQALPFSLEGVAAQGRILAASWDQHGLLVTAATGVTLECPGFGPTAGRWRCQKLQGGKLPRLATAAGGTVAVARAVGGGFQAAVIFPGEPNVVLFSRAGRPSASWMPAGEARTNVPAVAASFSAAGDGLLLTSANGEVTHMKIGDASATMTAAPVDGQDKHMWQSTCGLSDGGIARLALRNAGSGSSSVWEPTLLLG